MKLLSLACQERIRHSGAHVAVTALFPVIGMVLRQAPGPVQLLGDQHRIVPGQHDHGGAEADGFRPGREIGEQGHRGRDLAVAGEMVAGNPGYEFKAVRL